ncbi:MAG TPA: nickel pincer cofactor biosynthesis protein LarC [Polyangiaceae bacterium]|nr:nickel pincer cofactor biosynthesis protein LarC [Polyangiaceae bacterium]
MSVPSDKPREPRFRGIVRPAGHVHVHGESRGGDPLRYGNPRLERGAGAGKLLFFDCFSGVAGDMTVAALVDLGVPLDVIEQAIAALGVAGIEVRVEPAQSGVIGGVRFLVEARGNHPERSYAEIEQLLSASTLDDDTRQRAQTIFRRLAEAEAFVHRTPVEAVSFHEVGAVDAIADVVGAAAALAYLRADVVAAPLPLGHGSVECRHGVLPLPAPATVACLQGVPTYAAGIEAELVTPTGAAIVASQALRFERWPSLTPLAIGWGAGTKRLPDRLNALRVVLGEPVAQRSGEKDSDTTYYVLEANVDDMTGELVGHAMAKLLEAGALDAWATPITMKKGRPGLLLSALCSAALRGAIETVLLRETSSIGLRSYGVSRVERPRELIEVDTEFGKIPVKISRGPYGPPQLKPEFDACAHAAETHSVPVRTVIASALAAATALVPSK